MRPTSPNDVFHPHPPFPFPPVQKSNAIDQLIPLPTPFIFLAISPLQPHQPSIFAMCHVPFQTGSSESPRKPLIHLLTVVAHPLPISPCEHIDHYHTATLPEQ